VGQCLSRAAALTMLPLNPMGGQRIPGSSAGLLSRFKLNI
jgi:hypothetical protein